MRYNIFKYSCLAIVFAFVSCKKDPDSLPDSGYSVPTQYTFNNVNYSGQTYRLAMADELVTYMKSSANAGTVVDAQVMKNMFSNTASPFSDTVLNNCGKQLKDKFFLPDQPLVESYMDSMAIASQSSVSGSNGVAGIVTSNVNPLKKYCLAANGYDYAEMVEKSLMGAVFYYQAINTYLDNISSDDNSTVTPGQGTAMEHHFDEAFGYFGVPVDFPTNTTDVLFWGEYCNDLDAVLNSNTTIMNLFLHARAAISNQDYSTRGQKISSIIYWWEKIIAAAAIHEINEAMTYFADDALRNHTLSEFVGFVNATKYSAHATMTSQQRSSILGYIGGNLYAVTMNNLLSARDEISTIYQLDDIKTIL